MRRTADCVPPRVAWAAAIVVVTACGLFAASIAFASQMFAPAMGAADMATQGTRIADPFTPSTALFANPAGLAWFDRPIITQGVALGYVRNKISSSQPTDYDHDSKSWPFGPEFGLSVPYGDDWRVAIGGYGTSGSVFNFAANPGFSPQSFFSESIFGALPVAAAYRINDQLSVGFEVQPQFGQIRSHYALPTPLGPLPFKYKINGLGVQGMFGISVRITEEWAIGLSARTPGRTWMSGSMPLPGGSLQGVHVTAQSPPQAMLGTTWRCLPPLTISASARFTNTSDLGDSIIHFQYTPQADSPILPDAKDEWRFALGGEYVLPDELRLRTGVAWASYVTGQNGVNPLVFDNSDVQVDIGVGKTFGPWTIDVATGRGFYSSRNVPSQTALVFPGKYSTEGAMVAWMSLTYQY